jgi:hypothetical protein
MMGRQSGDQSRLFYLFNLEKRIPAGHLLRRINPKRTFATVNYCIAKGSSILALVIHVFSGMFAKIWQLQKNDVLTRLVIGNVILRVYLCKLFWLTQAAPCVGSLAI